MLRRFFVLKRLYIATSDVEDYRIVRRLGAGTFGEAYYAISVKYGFPVVIKIYNEWMRYSRMVREILIMQSLCGGTNILKLYDVVKEEKTKLPALVLEYVNAVSPLTLYNSMNASDIKYYARELLRSINYMHNNEIMHRDIKPSNILIDPDKRILRLIDFGISRFHYDGANHTDFETFCYQAPEALFEYYRYDLKADVWSFGVWLAGIIFRENYFFPGDSQHEQLDYYTRTLGTEGLIRLVEKYKIPCDRKITAFTMRPRVSWSQYINHKNRHLINDDILEVFNATFMYDPADRASAEDLLHYYYFRQEV